MSVAISPFPRVADTLADLARREAGGLELIEAEAARDPGSLWARHLPLLRDQARLVSEAYSLVSRLAVREPEIRAMLDGRL